MKLGNALFSVIILALNATFAAPATLAADASQVTQDVGENNATPSDKQPVDYTHAQYCPPVSALFMQNMVWRAPHGWVSFYQSFLKKIDSFTGAHWVGVDVGKVVCTYSNSENKNPDFPINLENNYFVKSPEGGEWGLEIQGVKNCNSNKVTDCPFYISDQEGKNIDYKELETIENTPSKEPKLRKAY